MESVTNIRTPYAIDEILRINTADFVEKAIQVFHFQSQNNAIYNQWLAAARPKFEPISSITDIPFLPISFFKTHEVKVGNQPAKLHFTSSGTTGMVASSHYVLDKDWYEKSFLNAFKIFYQQPKEWAVVGLLPSYLERRGSSLVYMVEHLITQTQNADSGLYLHNLEGLSQLLKKREATAQKTWLIGVTYALLDFAAQFPQPLKYTTILETGGMKGRKKEITRTEVQTILKNAFSLTGTHSEYGMTELLSQAYAKENGLFECPPWMKVLVRDEDDPFLLRTYGVGVLCIIDLANMYSCSFIATEDVGKVHEDGHFEVLGRLDNSDIRGCSLLTL